MYYLLLPIMLLFFNACTESYQGETQNSSDITILENNLSGSVTDTKGAALSNVRVHLRYQNRSVVTQENGSFSLNNIQAKNDMLILQKEGYYDGIFTYSSHDTQLHLQLKAKSEESVRLLFGGDLSFARRFMDPNIADRSTELVTQDVEGATLQVSNLYGSGQQVIDPIQPLFHSVDFPTVNFESIATRSQSTLEMIHPTKDYAYYTNDLSLPLLKDLNVNFVTLGNNHVYDYDTLGLQDTLDALAYNTIGFSGAGMNVTEAFSPYRTTIKNQPFSFVGATSVTGNQHALLYVAHENQGVDDPFATQGGAANAQDRSQVATTLQSERTQDYFTIYQMHGGKEYTYAPSAFALSLLYHAVESNASMVISHHPHTAQGYGIYNGVFIAYGMGNFIFDQDRLDTLLSHILVCDLNQTSITQARGYPIYIEDYIPKLLTGDLANRFIRHISEASRNGSALLEAPLKSDLIVFPYHYQEYIALDGQYSTSRESISQKVTIGEKGYSILDLRNLLDSSYSLSKISTDERELTITMGRDLLWFGSFEDDDVDTQSNENSIWNFSTAVASSSTAHGGSVSAHLLLDESNTQTALLYFGRRIRPIGDARNHPNKKLSFLGYFKGENARPFTIESFYYASVGDREFGSTLLHTSNGGSFDWQMIEASIPMPKDSVITDEMPTYLTDNPRATKFYIRMDAVHKGEAHLYVDDLAVINWEESYNTNEPVELSTPHARDFIKITGAKGEYNIALEFTRYYPSDAK